MIQHYTVLYEMEKQRRKQAKFGEPDLSMGARLSGMCMCVCVCVLIKVLVGTKRRLPYFDT